MKRIFIIISLVTFLLSGCVYIMENTGRFLDGSAFAESTVSVYRTQQIEAAIQNSDTSIDTSVEILIVQDRNSQRSVIINIDKYPMIKIRGSMPNEDNEFYLTSLEYFGSNIHGWNEFSKQLHAQGNLTLGDIGILEINEEIMQLQISRGRIHRYDTRITGEQALSALRNRSERISSLTEFMHTSASEQVQTITLFERYWKVILFPEIVWNNQRPSSWQQDNDRFERAQDISWNTGYTQRTFPEELHIVRNSGTMLQDWEEALAWIYFAYEWENIKTLLSGRIILQKIN